MKKYYKSIVTVELLMTEEPITGNVRLENIMYAINKEGVIEGSLSVKNTEISANEMLKEISDIGGDPEHVGLDKKGNEI